MSVTDCLFKNNDSLILVNTFYFISKDRNVSKPCHRINLCILLVITIINNLPECGSRSEVCSDLVLPTVWSDDWGSYNRRVKVNNTSESYLDMRIRTPFHPPSWGTSATPHHMYCFTAQSYFCQKVKHPFAQLITSTKILCKWLFNKICCQKQVIR